MAGRPLQLGRGPAGGPLQRPSFNPLLHGATSATRLRMPPVALGRSRFNPLLHGATSATSFMLTDTHGMPWGFNPLLHGAASATPEDVSGSESGLRVSIPYFTGRPLQL